MKRLIVFLLLSLSTLTLSNIGAFAQRRAAVSLAPTESVAVIKVNWAQMRQDDRLRRIVRGDDFERIVQQYGIDSEQITEWVVFSDIKPASANGLGMILSGTFSSRSIADHLKSQGWSEQAYISHKIYLNPADKSYAAPLQPGLLVVGTQAGVENVINVESNPQTGITTKPPFSTLLANFSRNPKPITFMIGIPQKYQATADVAYKVATKLIDFAGLSPLGTILDKIGLARALGFSISRDGSVYPIELVGLMKDETTTGLISGALNLMKSVPMMLSSRSMSQQDKDALDAIQGMSINSSGTLLSIKFNMPESGMPH
jgi:hypothetical protein